MTNRAALIMQLLAMRAAGKQVIYWANSGTPFAGDYAYRVLVDELPPLWLHPDAVERTGNSSRPILQEYNPEDADHREFVCIGCCTHEESCGQTVRSRVKYHFEPFPDD